MYGSAEKLVSTGKTLKPKPAPVFKLGDVVENIHSGEVFKIQVIAQSYGEVVYAPKMIHSHNGLHVEWSGGHSLRKYSAKK